MVGWFAMELTFLMVSGMYKNQLQELAQRSCFNLPAYACIREGPDHAPRFKATVNFNGEVFESPNYCNTLRQAEHAAAEVALNTLSRRGPSQSLAARILVSWSVFMSRSDGMCVPFLPSQPVLVRLLGLLVLCLKCRMKRVCAKTCFKRLLKEQASPFPYIQPLDLVLGIYPSLHVQWR